MSKSIRSKSPIRTILFLSRQIKCLVLQKSKDMEKWLKIWGNIQKLPNRELEKIEWSILKGMKDIPFAFEDGHKLYNEGSCRYGRKAMWLGVNFASSALERQKREVRHCETVLDSMFKNLNPGGNNDFSKEDKMAVKIIGGELGSMMDTPPKRRKN